MTNSFGLVFMALAYGVIAAFFSLLSAGIGLLLQACFPSLVLGHAIIAGSIVGVAAFHFLCKVLHTAETLSEGGKLSEDLPVVVLPRDLAPHFPGRRKTARSRR